ncbi:MAG: hypothetical protein P4M11_12455 [Candidatus Pacebacteria bacterium]|nr:hypothetical protein [Candidatus Paceibacterota bacterium]
MSKYLLSRFGGRREINDSYYDKEGNVDAKVLVITIKVAEIALKLASSPKFFEPSKNDLLHDWLYALIEFGNRLTKLRKDCKFEKISQLLCAILSCATDYSITNGNTPPMLESVRKSSIASLILNNLLAKPEILPQLNLEALGCLANYSQYPEFLEKKELHECDVVNRALVVYYAYKDYVDIPRFQSFLVAVLHHFAQNPVFHQYLGKRQFNLLPLLQQSAAQDESVPTAPEPAATHAGVLSVTSTPILGPMASPITPKTPLAPPTVLAPAPLNDLAKMLDVYEQLTRTSAKAIKHKEVLEAICQILKEGKNTEAMHVDQGLSIICNLAANKQVAEEEKSIEQVLKCLKEVHGKYMKAFLTHCPQILSGYLRKWDDARIQKFFDPVIDLVKNLLSNYEKGNVGLLFRQFDKLCRPPDLLKRLVTTSDILPNLCAILAGFIKAPSGAMANLPRINEILNILQYMSLIDESHKEMRKPVQGGEPVLELCYNVYKNMTTLDGDRDSLILKLISSVIHIQRNIYKKASNEAIRDYAETQLGQHIVYFNIARKLLEGEDSIKDDDILIKILWSFCSVKKILYP